jgi:HAD superfamily hydrolase (TIGR01509 family)
MKLAISGCLEELLEDECLKIKAIVIDMDGTITNFNLDFMSFRRRALGELEKMGLRTPDMNEQLPLFMILRKLSDKVDINTFRGIRKKIYSMIEETELKAAVEVTLYPGAVNTLRKLRDQSVKIGLVTNNGRNGTDLTLSRHRLHNLFDAVVTRDDCQDMKPAAEPVLKVLAKLMVTSGEAVLVGDGVMDIMAAKAAGIPSVAVATGPFKSDLLLKAAPDYVLGSINDLPKLIDSLNTAKELDL